MPQGHGTLEASRSACFAGNVAANDSPDLVRPVAAQANQSDLAVYAQIDRQRLEQRMVFRIQAPSEIYLGRGLLTAFSFSLVLYFPILRIR